MKIIYLMIGIAIMFGSCKGSNKEDFTTKQGYNFELQDSRNGKREIKNPQKQLILYSLEEEEDSIYNNLIKYFEFSKVQYDKKDILGEIGDIEDYASIIFTGKNYSGINKKLFTKVMEYVEGGGNLIFLSIPYSSPFNTYMGIEEKNDYIKTDGIHFKKSFFPGLDDIEGTDSIVQGSSLEVTLNEGVEIIATESKNNPLIWESSVGSGKILSVNTTIIDSRMARGLLAQIISYGNDYFIMPILNSKVIHIDNFPAPIPSETNKQIYEEYNMKTKEFFQKVWWKDMEEFAIGCNLKYTANMIAEYTEVTNKKKMKDVFQIHKKDLIFFGERIMQSNGELGVHGYNQNPFFLEGELDFDRYSYNSWKDEESIEYSIEKLRGVIDDVYGEEMKIYTYTPPGNLLSLGGKTLLVKNLPDLKTLSGIYTGTTEKGILIQEIGRDPDFPNIYSMPRFSSGFIYSEDKMWNIYNGVASYGLVSHYVQPYEVLIEQGMEDPLSWNRIRLSLKKIFVTIEKNFPELEGQVQSEVTKKYMILEEANILHEMNEKEIDISIENYRGEINTFVRIREEEIEEVIGGEYSLIDATPEYNLYLVKLQSEDVKILLGGA